MSRMYKCEVIVIFLISIISRSFCNSKFEIFSTVSPQQVYVNNSVNLTCHVTLPQNGTRHFGIFWSKNAGSTKGEVSENCVVFDKKKFAISYCDMNAAKIVLTIKNVSWDDRGEWSCKYSQNLSTVNIDVLSPAHVTNLQVTSLTKGKVLVGEGKKDFPYDLTDGGGVELECNTNCGYPNPRVLFEHRAVNTLLKGKLMEVEDPVYSATCNDVLLKKTAVKSYIRNCSLDNLDGLTSVTCMTSGSDLGKTVYFSCPVIARHFPLTPGEIVAISVGALLGVFLLIAGCVLIFKGKSVSDDMDDGETQPMSV